MTDEQPTPRPAAEISHWLRTTVAALLKTDAREIDTSARFETLGLDSASAVRVTMDLEDWLGRPVDPALLYEFRTIDQLAAALARSDGDSTSSKTGADSASDGSQ